MKFFDRIALIVATIVIALFCTGASINGKAQQPGMRPTNADILFLGCLSALTVSNLIPKAKK